MPDDDDHVDGVRYVSELRWTTGLLFIPQVIYEHGEPWWNDVNRGNSWLVHPSSLAILPAKSSGRKQNWAKRIMNFALWSFFFIFASDFFFTYCKSYDVRPTGFTSSLKEGVVWTFIAHQNPPPRPVLNPRTLGLMTSILSNHYTTKVTREYLTFVCFNFVPSM
jgi:hypothetical protein